MTEQRGTQPIEQQSSASPCWGKLIAKTPGLATHPLTLAQTTMGRKTTNTVVINDPRLSGVHCVVLRQGSKCFVEDRSSNGTFINNTKMSKGARMEVKHGDEIWLLHQSKVQADSARGYVLEMRDHDEEQRKVREQEQELRRKEEELRRKEEELRKELQTKNEQEIQKVEEEKKKITEQSNELMKALKEQITCCICLELMHMPVTVHPCNHRFCASCLTGLVKSKQQNCAQCRKEITTAQRDSSFNSLIEDYLKRHPEEKRSKEEEQTMEKNNIFGYDTVNIKEIIHGKVPAPRAPAARGRPSRAGRALVRRAVDDDDEELSADSDGPAAICSECRVARNGFQCAPGQVHGGCVTCGKRMALRGDPTLGQSCVLCEQHFCNLYNPPCMAFGVKLSRVSTREPELRLDENTLRSNAYEFNILKDYMKSKKITSKDIFQTILRDHMDKNTFRYIVDRKIMKIPPLMSREIPVTRTSPVCDICWVSLWFQMVMLYRGTITPDLPSSVTSRPDCYYGINCGTMTHKPDHARKLNHCCFQTRF